jgi:hypothetical protein
MRASGTIFRHYDELLRKVAASLLARKLWPRDTDHLFSIADQAAFGVPIEIAGPIDIKLLPTPRSHRAVFGWRQGTWSQRRGGALRARVGAPVSRRLPDSGGRSGCAARLDQRRSDWCDQFARDAGEERQSPARPADHPEWDCCPEPRRTASRARSRDKASSSATGSR